MKLESHLRLVHMRLHPSATKLGYFQFNKLLKAIPPDRPVEGFNLDYCQYHAVPTGKCAVCMEIENKSGPKPPYQLYNHFLFDLAAKDEALSASGLNSGNSPAKVKKNAHQNHSKYNFHYHDHQSVVVLYDITGRNEEIRGRIIFNVVDRNHVGWIGLERLYTINELMVNNIVPFDFNKSNSVSKYELFPERSLNIIKETASTANSPDASIAFSISASLQQKYGRLPNDVVQWFPIHTIQRVLPIYYLPKSEIGGGGGGIDNESSAAVHVPIGTFHMRE
jgi:hypothetical protein